MIIIPRFLPSVISYYHKSSLYLCEVEISGPNSIKVELNGKVWIKAVNFELPIQLIFDGLELIEVIALNKPELMEPDEIVDDEW